MKKENIKNIILLFLFVAIIIFIGLVYNTHYGSINSFEECAAAGNPIMESYPRQCAANGQTFTEQIEGNPVYCTQESRGVEACITIYQPVCGWFEDDSTTPYQTFGNSCVACSNESVIYWTSGECLT